MYKYKFETIEDSKLETEFRKRKLRMEIFETGIILEVSDINNNIGDGIGEIILTSIDKEGIQKGFELELTEKISKLSDHFKKFKKDKHSTLGLAKSVNKRKKLLVYLKKKNPDSY